MNDFYLENYLISQFFQYYVMCTYFASKLYMELIQVQEFFFTMAIKILRPDIL